MHLGEKEERDFDFGPTAVELSGPADLRRVVPRAAVALSLGFEHGEAYLYAPIDKDTTKAGRGASLVGQYRAYGSRDRGLDAGPTRAVG
jgi:hypothetical protein